MAMTSFSKYLVLLGALLLCSACSNMFLYPTKDYVVSPARLSLAYRQLIIRDKNQADLSAWLLLANQPAKGLIVFVHGNAQNMSNHLASIYWLPAAGYHVLTFDYRGYGKSAGGKSLTGAAKDIKRAILFSKKLNQSMSGGNLKIYLYAQSLGASLSVSALSDMQVKAVLSKVILEGTFASYRQIFREKASLFWLTSVLAYPLSYSLPEDLSAERHIAKISPIPLLLIQGENDFIVPPANGPVLENLARQPKSYWSFPNKGHLEIFLSKENRQQLIEYLNE
ncbi:MAG: alpha/beta hydrolase [Deltaproteobacteria bacterium]|nr:alpha/beta hydrolase [Deltaproteobacteria bacterium]